MAQGLSRSKLVRQERSLHVTVNGLRSSEYRRCLGNAFPAQTGLAGSDNRLRPVGNLQLREDVGDVVAYGVGTDKEARGDPGVAVALGD